MLKKPQKTQNTCKINLAEGMNEENRQTWLHFLNCKKSGNGEIVLDIGITSNVLFVTTNVS